MKLRRVAFFEVRVAREFKMASGELLNMLQKSARSGTLLSSCEPEVKELMHQLDVLISEHQVEWAEQMKKAKLQLQLRQKEVATLKLSLCERTEQLERLRLQSLQQEQDHRARHADCEAQLVRVRSELSRLRQSYEQLKAKRGQSKPSADSGGSGATNYRQECHSLRRQLTEGREREKEMERQCGELREMVRKRDMQLEGLEVERRQSQQGVAYLQETVKDREGMIRKLEEEVSVARLSAGCQTELQQVQQELKAQLQLEQELRESLHRAKEEGGIWRENLSKLKSERDRQESELIHVLEQRVQNLERQLRESQLNKEGAHITAIKKFNEQTEQLLRTPVSTSEGGYVALEPLHQLASSEVEESERWTKVLEDVLGKHFDQLDCSVQRILSPN